MAHKYWPICVYHNLSHGPRLQFDAKEYVDVIMDGLKVENTQFFSHEGMVTDERKTIAWRERHRYAALLGDLIGAKVGRQQFEGPDGGPVQCQVAIVHVGNFTAPRAAPAVDVQMTED